MENLRLKNKDNYYLIQNPSNENYWGFFCLESALKVEITIIIKKITQTKFIVFQLVKLINTPADKLAIA